MDVLISDKESLERASAVLIDARFRRSDIQIDEINKTFVLSIWIPSHNRGRNATQREVTKRDGIIWQQYQLRFDSVANVELMFLENVSFYEIGRIHLLSAHNLQIKGHYAVTIDVEIIGLKGRLRSTNVTRTKW